MAAKKENVVRVSEWVGAAVWRRQKASCRTWHPNENQSAPLKFDAKETLFPLFRSGAAPWDVKADEEEHKEKDPF